MKKLVKELILVSGLTRLHLGAFVKRVIGLADAAIAHPLIAPDLDPTPLEIKTKADALTKEVEERTAMELAVLAKTKGVNTKEDDLRNLINNSWAHQAQTACAGDAEKATDLGWFIKGIVTGKAPVVVGMAADSHPITTGIDNRIHLVQTVNIINSASGLVGVPKDADRLDVYQQVGGLTPPNDIKKMANVGSANRGKFSCSFDISELDTIIYYIVVYIDKKTKLPLVMSPVMSAVVS
ncbi:MAG: hypothetical protein WCL51_12665 [Bacteroidota bacterium]